MSEQRERRCPQCDETKPLDIEHFTPRKRCNETGEILEYSYWCRPCSRRKAAERRAKRTPEQIEADRRYHRSVYEMEQRNEETVRRRRERQRAYRSSPRGRAVANAWAREAYWRMKADPERHAAYLEDKRIKYHLKRLEANGDQRFRKSSAVNGYRGGADVVPIGRVAELVAELDRWIKALGSDEIAARTGVSDRVLRRYVNGENDYIEFESIDRITLAFGIPLDTVVDLDEFKPLQQWLRDERMLAA